MSRSTIRDWLADPLYEQVCQELQVDARTQGFVTISAMVPDMLAMAYTGAQTDPSGFVRFKFIELLLRYAGMEQPQSLGAKDDKTEVNRFLDEVRTRAPQQTNVNVHISLKDDGSPASDPTVVDALPPAGDDPLSNSLLSHQELDTLTAHQQAMLAEYDQPLLPGGKLPGAQERQYHRRKESDDEPA